MPKKSKGKFKPYRNKIPTNYAEAEVFRNSLAVMDDTDPFQSLKYLQDIFRHKLDEDVVTMIFSECAFDVDQAFETLMSLSNDDGIKRTPDKSEGEKKDIFEVISVSKKDNSTGENTIASDLSQNTPNKSKLAIKFPSLSANPAERTFLNKTEKLANGYQSALFNQDKNFGFPYPSDALKNSSNYQMWSNGCSLPYKYTTKFQDCFSPTFYTKPDISNSYHNSTNDSNDCVPIFNQKFTNSTPKFITPFMPAPLYTYGSPSFCKSPVLEANNTQKDMSKSMHFSSPVFKNKNHQKTHNKIQEVVSKIKLGSHILIILRGLPGSGKSTLGINLKFSGEVFSTDDYFYKNGEYLFDATKLSEAHTWNKQRTKKALEKGVTPIIIDNTNVEAWEFKPYILLGRKYNYEIIILEPDTPWKFDVYKLSLRNKHGVSRNKIAKMKERYEHNITVENIIASVALSDTDCIDSSEVENFDENEHELKNISNFEYTVIKDNHICLEADIHQEEAANDSMLNVGQIDNDSVAPAFENKNDVSQNNIHKTKYFHLNQKFNISTDDQSVSIQDLDQLRALIREDSDDSQSHYSSANDSSHDVCGWEAITEHDDDFLWSGSSEEKGSVTNISNKNPADVLSIKKSNQDNCPQTILTPNSSSQNNTCKINNCLPINKTPKEDISESLEINSKLNLHEDLNNIENAMAPKLITDYDNLILEKSFDNWNLIRDKRQDKSTFCLIPSNPEDSLSTVCEQNINTDSLKLGTSTSNLSVNQEKEQENALKHIFVEENVDNNLQIYFCNPKSQRTNSDLFLNSNKINLKTATLFNDSVNFMDDEKDTEWNIVDSEVEAENSKKECDSEMELLTAIPKPQRQIYENKSPQNGKGSINDTDRCNKSSSIFNISIDMVESDWKFPDYISSDTSENESHDEKPLTLKMCMYSQTEPCDFVFTSKISVGDQSLNSSKYRILTAHPDRFKDSEICTSSLDLQINHYTQIVTFDKSTSTYDYMNDIKMSQKLTHLHNCFPDISIEDIHHLLEMCHNDDAWVSNLLLEWGYKYNVQIENNHKSDLQETSVINEENKNSNTFENNVISIIKDEHSYTQFENKNSAEFVSPCENLDIKTHLEDYKKADLSNTEIDSTCFKNLHLTLDSAFAYQLEELFGPVSSEDSNASRCVEIDIEFARLLHAKWKSSVQKRSHEDDKRSKDDFTCLQNKEVAQSDQTVSLQNNNKVPSLSEIMDMEYALQLHKWEKLKKDTDFSTKLKRLELYNMFPGADTIALDEIFESNNYSLKNTVIALGEDFGQEVIQQKKAVEKIDACVTQCSKSDVIEEFETGDWSDWVYKEDVVESLEETTMPLLTSTISAEASELRELATKHYRFRQECIRKAQTAYCRGMNSAASFYAQQGAEHGQLFKDANKKASELIAQQRNMTSSALVLDLHGLFIQEAIPTLEKFLRDKKLDLKRRRQTSPLVISVITGQGLHSVKGPKLRPSVLEYLKRAGYCYNEIKPGMLEVTLTSE